MLAGLRLAINHRFADLAPDGHPAGIGVVILSLQDPTEILCFNQYFVVVGGPDPEVEFGGVGGAGMWWFGWRLYDGVVVYA